MHASCPPFSLAKNNLQNFAKDIEILMIETKIAQKKNLFIHNFFLHNILKISPQKISKKNDTQILIIYMKILYSVLKKKQSSESLNACSIWHFREVYSLFCIQKYFIYFSFSQSNCHFKRLFSVIIRYIQNHSKYSKVLLLLSYIFSFSHIQITKTKLSNLTNNIHHYHYYFLIFFLSRNLLFASSILSFLFALSPSF